VEKDYKKMKRALTLARTQLIKANQEKEPVMFDLQLALAEIAYNYEDDDYTVNLECNRAWEYAEAGGYLNSHPGIMLDIARTSMKYCGENVGNNKLWAQRILEACGVIIDRGGRNAEAACEYVFRNVMLFLGYFRLDKSITVKRVSRCVDVMKFAGQDKVYIATAQWLAGCATLCIGKTEDKKEAVKLIMDASRVIKEVAGKREMILVAVGEGYVGDYHFQKGDYERAEKWYEAALSYVRTSPDEAFRAYGKIYSDRIADCQKRM
jgi:tetratricopeptide (TPR) repeat protein